MMSDLVKFVLGLLVFFFIGFIPASLLGIPLMVSLLLGFILDIAFLFIWENGIW